MTTFGALLRSLRIAYGYSEEEFAGRIDVTKEAVSKFENGKSYPSRKNLGKILKEFPMREHALMSLFVEQDLPSPRVYRIREDMQYYLAEKIEDLFDAYIKGKSNEELEDRFGNERVGFFWFPHMNYLFAVDFLAQLKARAKENSQFVTVKGECNLLIFPWLIEATRNCPIETRFICPECNHEQYYYSETDVFNKTEKCEVCKSNMINVSQYCNLPWNEFDALFCMHPYNLEIDVPPQFANFATNMAVYYFSPIYSLKKRVLFENGVKYYSIILADEGKTKCDSIEQIPTIDTDDDICFDRPRIIIRPNELNQLLSERLAKEKPDLVKLYNRQNIVKLAEYLKTRLPKMLQSDVDDVCNISQLTNILILLDQYHTGDEKSLSCKVIRELKRALKIDNWTRLPLAKEDYRIWKDLDKEKNHDNWVRIRKINDVEVMDSIIPDYIQKFEGCVGDCSKGVYSDVLYTLLLKSYFGL